MQSKLPRIFASLSLSVVALLATAAFSAPAAQAGEPIMRLQDVQPGMVGQGLTVFHGTTPEPFKFSVVSVLHNFLPKQDVILIRIDDERIDKTGVAAGMSGSPCYIDGKVIGAVAYAWSFSKEPLAGVTPIESMVAERTRPERRKGDALAQQGRAPAVSALASAGEGARFGEGRLMPVAVPLAISGLSDRALVDVSEELKPLGMVAMRGAGGGGRSGRVGPGKVIPGGAIGVELIRGDMSAVGTGTVTYVDGDNVFAFGHPMLGAGEVSLPMVDAEIATFMPSLATSFKMASPLGEVGALVQDRQSCIMGDLKRRSPMLPLTVTVNAPESKPFVFRTEIARDRRLTPVLASMVLASALSVSEPDPVDVVVGVETKVDVRNLGSLTFADHLASGEGVSPRVLAASRGVRALGDLLTNPFEPAVIDRMDVQLQVEYRRDVADIVGVSLPSATVRAGESVPLRVTLRPYAGAEYTETVPVMFPRALAGQPVRVEVASGALVKPDLAKPETLKDYVQGLRTYYTAASLVVSLSTPDSGAFLRGHLLRDLPPSAMEALRTTSASPRADAYHVVDRTVQASTRLVSGKREITVRVEPDLLGVAR